ncbi:FAD-binding oxidoreductase [Acidisoma cellulosilytica]|uniref:FAD-binding oxidoreductase n=1 Tax=Acidisoma cellulosilyticum TaxID=2802395 RepID=A0A963YYS8_9PROT|nr:FAD-binding oxidoreductase [Acidisoma cellulosilyticum]MCB8879475.1 FAD-binding oxidoreductase [Acidisoma cellulosilyticum]
MSVPARAAHAPSYYAATRNPAPLRPPLVGDVRADVCIIGAGFTGISAALTLAEAGIRAVVLEGKQIGWGASGRNGGQIVNGYSRDLGVIESRYGATAAKALGVMALEGGDIIRERVATYDIQCDLVPGGYFAALTERQMRELEHQKRVWEKHGHNGLEMVGRQASQDIARTRIYCGGMIDHRAGHLHPLNLVLGEAAAAESLGAVIHEDSPVTGIADDGSSVTVSTDRGRVIAKTVLVCGNAYLGDAVPELTNKIMPVSTQVVATAPLDPKLLDSLLTRNFCVEDCNYILDYYRRTADHRLLFGGGIVYGGTDPASIEGKIRPHLDRTFPELRGVTLDFAWSGNFALTMTRVPHVGRLSPNVLFSHGDSGHGVTTTHLLGRLLGEAVQGRMARFDTFAALPYFPFPGGQRLRVPLTVLGAWWYGLRDRLAF